MGFGVQGALMLLYGVLLFILKLYWFGYGLEKTWSLPDEKRVITTEQTMYGMIIII